MITQYAGCNEYNEYNKKKAIVTIYKKKSQYGHVIVNKNVHVILYLQGRSMM